MRGGKERRKLIYFAASQSKATAEMSVSISPPSKRINIINIINNRNSIITINITILLPPHHRRKMLQGERMRVVVAAPVEVVVEVWGRSVLMGSKLQ